MVVVGVSCSDRCGLCGGENDVEKEIKGKEGGKGERIELSELH